METELYVGGNVENCGKQISTVHKPVSICYFVRAVGWMDLDVPSRSVTSRPLHCPHHGRVHFLSLELRFDHVVDAGLLDIREQRVRVR